MTIAEFRSLQTRVTRYKAEDGHERAVLLWTDYEAILETVRLELGPKAAPDPDDVPQPHCRD